METRTIDKWAFDSERIFREMSEYSKLLGEIEIDYDIMLWVLECDGFSKEEIIHSITILEKAGLIKRELRDRTEFIIIGGNIDE